MTFKNPIARLMVMSMLALGAPAVADGTSSLLTSLDDREFQEMMPGIDFSIVSGDPAGAASTLVVRLAPNFPGAMHNHSSAYTAVVLKGAHRHWDLGQDSADVPTLLPGDTFYQPGGAFHQDANPTSEASYVFITMHGPLDFHMHK